MNRRRSRPRRQTGASIPDVLVKKEPGRPVKERVSTNNPSLQGAFINKKRKEGGGAVLEVVDEDPNITTHIIEPRSSQIVGMDLEEQGNMVKIETENRYGKKETSFITQTPNDPGFENKLREGQLLSDIKKTTKNQSSGLANKYKQHEIRSLAEHVGAKVDASNITTINNIRKKIATRKVSSQIQSNPNNLSKSDFYIQADTIGDKLQKEGKFVIFDHRRGIKSDQAVSMRTEDFLANSNMTMKELEKYQEKHKDEIQFEGDRSTHTAKAFVTIYNPNYSKEVQKQEFTILQPTQNEVRKSEILTTPQVKRYEYYTMAVHDATNSDQLSAIHKELVDDKGLPDIYKKEVRYKIEYKTNDLRERHLKYEFSYDKKILHAHTKEQLMDIREQFGNSSLSQAEKEQLDKKWNNKWKYLQDLESDRDGQQYLNMIDKARSEKDLEIVKKQIANNKTFNPTEGQIETLNNAFKKKTQELIDNKKDEKELTQEMEDLLFSKERLDYKNLSGKQEEEFRKQFKLGLIPPYRRGAGATTYYKDGIEYYFYTEPTTGMIQYDGAVEVQNNKGDITNKKLNLTIPEIKKRLGWEQIDIEPFPFSD